MELKAKEYTPGSVGFFDFSNRSLSKGFQMIADYKKATEIINHLLSKGKEIYFVEMGLDGDWNYNSCVIFDKGVFDENEYTEWGSSDWATPIILVTYLDGSKEAYEVWHKETF